MRVAVDARELQGQVTGVGRYLGELLARWSRDAATADVTLTLYAPGPLDVPHLLGTGGARVDCVRVPGGAGTIWEQTQLPRAIRNRTDVLFAPGYSAPLFSPVPTVVSIHDLSFFAHPEWFRPREGVRRRWITRLAARRAARVLTISEFSRAEIIRLLGIPAGRVTVTPPGSGGHLGGVRPVARTLDGGSSVLFVGSILNRRHLPTLVRAFVPIARRDPAARLVIVGENRTFPFEDPAGTAAEEGIASQVDVRAYVPDAELAELYSRASVFAFLSTYEGFGFTPLEAMSAGVPVVAYDTPVAREVYGPAALLVPIGSRESVTRALEAAMGDAALRARLDVAARSRLQALSWEHTASLTMQALREASRRQ